eukprot:gene10743-10899_t
MVRGPSFHCPADPSLTPAGAAAGPAVPARATASTAATLDQTPGSLLQFHKTYGKHGNLNTHLCNPSSTALVASSSSAADLETLFSQAEAQVQDYLDSPHAAMLFGKDVSDKLEQLVNSSGTSTPRTPHAAAAGTPRTPSTAGRKRSKPSPQSTPDLDPGAARSPGQPEYHHHHLNYHHHHHHHHFQQHHQQQQHVWHQLTDDHPFGRVGGGTGAAVAGGFAGCPAAVHSARVSSPSSQGARRWGLDLSDDGANSSLVKDQRLEHSHHTSHQNSHLATAEALMRSTSSLAKKVPGARSVSYLNAAVLGACGLVAAAAAWLAVAVMLAGLLARWSCHSWNLRPTAQEDDWLVPRNGRMQLTVELDMPDWPEPDLVQAAVAYLKDKQKVVAVQEGGFTSVFDQRVKYQLQQWTHARCGCCGEAWPPLWSCLYAFPTAAQARSAVFPRGSHQQHGARVLAQVKVAGRGYQHPDGRLAVASVMLERVLEYMPKLKSSSQQLVHLEFDNNGSALYSSKLQTAAA